MRVVRCSPPTHPTLPPAVLPHRRRIYDITGPGDGWIDGCDWFTGAHRHEGGGSVTVPSLVLQALGYATVLGLVSWHSHSYPSWILYHRHPHSYYSHSLLDLHQYPDIRRMLELVKGYVDNGSGSESINDTLDRAYDPLFSTTKGERVRSIQGETLAKIQEWIETIDKQYCKNVDPAKADVAFLRTPMEVGWAENIPSRIKEQDHASQTTALLFLVNATTKQAFTLPIKEHALLFPIPYDGENSPLYAIAEILASILCSSYHGFGGLNVHLAGSCNRITMDSTDDVWYTSAVYHDRRLRLEHVDGEVMRLKKRLELLTAAPELLASRDELAAAIDEYESTVKKKYATMAEYRELLETYGQRRQESDQTESERAEGESEDMIPGGSALLAEWKKPDQKARIRTLLRLCVNTEDEEAIDLFSEELALFDEDLIAEATQEFEESRDRNHKLAMESLKRFGEQEV